MNYIIRCERQDPLVQWYCTDRDEDHEPIGIVNGITADQTPPGAGYWMTTYRVTATQVWVEALPLDELIWQAADVFGSLAEFIRPHPQQKDPGAAETATVIYKNTALALLIAEHGNDELIWQRVERQATLRLMDRIKGDEDASLIRSATVSAG